jgi:phosphoribosylformylglycinamidine synthase
VVVSVEAEKVDAFKSMMGNHPFEFLGTVTSGDVKVEGESWGDIQSWKDRYDSSIANLLAGHESEFALTAL